MILGVVIGNTNIRVGYMNYFHSYKNKNHDFLDIRHLKPKKIFLASVVPDLTEQVFQALMKIFDIKPNIICKEDIPINLEKYDKKNIGIDRILSCYGAYDIPTAYAIFDLGTAISISIVNSKKEFLGGAIMPGIELGLSALGNGTALLPVLPKVDMLNKVIGSDTKSCLSSGAIYGTLSMVEGMAKRIEKELEESLKVIVTGGFQSYIPWVDCDIDVLLRPNIVIEGLLKI